MINVNVEENVIPMSTTKFPILGISKLTNEIVLFINPCCGTVLSKGDSHHYIGKYSDGWDTEYFIFVPELKVTLKNV